MTISFIGTAGIPNCYGGFESFLEHCTPMMVAMGVPVIVTCDGRLYTNQEPIFNGVQRLFLNVPANGILSIFHDLLAFFRVFIQSNQIVVLGVSGGIWFPFFRLLCEISGKHLIVNIDGLEWRRTKFSPGKQLLLKLFCTLAQKFSHHVIYDNKGLYEYLPGSVKKKSTCISYPGDHVIRLKSVNRIENTALTICRIEPENNVELLIQAALNSNLSEYTIIGNWNHSEYSRYLREKYKLEPCLKLLDPIYEPKLLAKFRQTCNYYLHGHSVGGTNPSLVEMLFYDCNIFCFDVEFNRNTAGECATYFKTANELKYAIDSFSSVTKPNQNLPMSRQNLRLEYTAEKIVEGYIQLIHALSCQAK